MQFGMFIARPRLVVIVLVALGLCFFLGFYTGGYFERRSLGTVPELGALQVPTSTPAQEIAVPDVRGFYTLNSDPSTYIQVQQAGDTVVVTGYTTHATLAGSDSKGYLRATTTVVVNGTVHIALSQNKNDPCDMYLAFYHKRENYTVPDEHPEQVNALRVVQTTSGLSCGLGNNISFDFGNVFYEKQNMVPAVLPGAGERG